jgi:hypothetical protein
MIEFFRDTTYSFFVNFYFSKSGKVIFGITGRLGRFIFIFSLCGLIFNLIGGSHFFIIRGFFFRNLVGYLRSSFFGLNFGWTVRYDLVGYNYTMRIRPRRGLLLLHLGYSRHKLLVVLPRGLRVFGRRRKLYLHCLDFSVLQKWGVYFMRLRDLFPFKYKALVLVESQISLLKPGKKTKYR